MSITLTIRNLDEAVKQKLRLQAALHQRSMEAEARAILSASLSESTAAATIPETRKAERRGRMEAALGIWKNRYEGKSTDDIMQELRGDD